MIACVDDQLQIVRHKSARQQCDQQQKNIKAQADKKTSNRLSPGRPKRQQHASRAAEKPAERQKSQQTGIDQQNGKEASRTAKRPAEQQKPTSKYSTWNNSEHQKLSTDKKISIQFLIVSIQFLIVRHDQRARLFLFNEKNEKKAKKELDKNTKTYIIQL